jgi:hypothetical protein
MKERFVGLYLMKDAMEWKEYTHKSKESEVATELLLRCSEMNNYNDESWHLKAAKIVRQGLRPDGVWVNRDVVLYREFSKRK